MRWADLLFAHWPISPAVLRPHVPDTLELETHDGSAWIGIVPFRMEDVAPRGVPALPGVSAFPELNVRTYVQAEGKPGVWFMSLDAFSRLAVWGARSTFHLPYFFAHMKVTRTGDDVFYRCVRAASETAHSGVGRFEGRYGPTGPAYHASPGTLEHWLTARYCLYAADRAGGLFRGEIQHQPWLLRRAQADITVNTMAAASRIDLPDCPPLLHFVDRIDVVAWALQRVER